jgi:hypothetical protein
MAEQPYQPILVTFGGAKKSCFDMSQGGWAEAAANIVRRARVKAFSKGLPIYYGEDHKVYAAYADRHVELVKK